MALAVAEVTGTNFGAAATAHACDISTANTVAAGELLIACLGWPTTTSSVSATDSTGDAWTRKESFAITGAANIAIFAKDADGDEDSASVGITTGAAEDASGVVYRITGFNGDLVSDIQVSSLATGTADGNPPSVSAVASGNTNLFIIFSLLNNNEVVNTNPANYTEGYEFVDSGVDHTFWSGYRLVALNSDDPGTIDYADADAGDSWAAATIVVEDVSGGTPATVTPSPIAVTTALPSASIAAGAVKTPSPVAVTTALPTPTRIAGANVAGAVIPIVTALPAATALGGTASNPATIPVTITVPTASPNAPATVTPLTIAAVAALPTPSPAVAAGAAPQTIPVTVALPTPVIRAASLVTPSPIAVTTALPTATKSVPGTVNPSVIAILTTLPQPGLAYGATVSPAVIAVNVALPSPNIFAGTLEIIAKVAGQFQRLAGRLHLAKIGRGNRRGFRISEEGWERVSDIFIYDEALEGDANQVATMEAVAAAWALHAGSDEATLKAAINQALDNLGYRRPDGSRLV